jgi:hypothetical protein
MSVNAPATIMTRLIIETSVVSNWMTAASQMLHKRARLDGAIPK